MECHELSHVSAKQLMTFTPRYDRKLLGLIRDVNIQAQRPRPSDNAALAMGGMVLFLLGQSIGKIILKPFSKRSSQPQDHRTDTNFMAELKKISGSGKSEQEHVPHFLHTKSENQEVSGRFTWQSCKSTARKCTRKSAAIRPIVVFHSSGQGHPTTVFCKISVRRSKFCLEFSFTWLKIST